MMQTLLTPTDTSASRVAVLRHIDEVAAARREVLEHELVDLRRLLERRGAA